jgi:hypothetical protein
MFTTDMNQEVTDIRIGSDNIFSRNSNQCYKLIHRLHTNK